MSNDELWEVFGLRSKPWFSICKIGEGRTPGI